jgi:hypothetical protein
MNNPYRAPSAAVAEASLAPRPNRFIHALVAFVSGVVLGPLTFYAAAYAVVGASAIQLPTDILFWGLSFIGGCVAFVALYPFKSTPVWLAGILGPIFVLAVFLGYVFWID